MSKKTARSKLVHPAIVLCLSAFVVLGCATPTATPATTSTPTPAATSTPTTTPTTPSNKQPQYGGILKIGATSGPSIGYPPRQTATGQVMAAPAIETLFRTDAAGAPVPWLATGYTNDVASKTITVALNRGVKFHDGTDFNADAVKWVLSQYKTAVAPGTARITSVDVIDDYTVRINLSEWDSTVISNLTSFAGMMISPTAYKKYGESWVMNNPVGTGPFKFVSWQIDILVKYERFDSYWQKGKPYLDGINYFTIVDALTRKLSFLAGDIDVARGLPADDRAELEKAGYVISSSTTGGGIYGMVPDSATTGSPFADVRVRQATQYAIDTKAIVKAIFGGLAGTTNQWASPGYWSYNPSVVGYPYNPTKAKQLLAEAGYPNGFKTKLQYHTAISRADLVFTAVQGFLKEVGIDLALEPIPLAKWTQIATQGGSWEGLIAGGPLAADTAAGLVARFSGGAAYSKMLIPDDYLKTIQNAVIAPDFETKKKYVQEALKMLSDKYSLVIPVFVSADFTPSRSKVHDHGFAQPGGWTPADAWLEK